MKYIIARPTRSTAFVTNYQCGDDDFRRYFKNQGVECSGYRYKTAIETIDRSPEVIVVLRDPYSRYDSAISYLHASKNMTSTNVDLHSSPYLEAFVGKKIKYILFEKLNDYFPCVDQQPLVDISEIPPNYNNGELDEEMDNYTRLIERNEELTVEEFTILTKN